jgi:hypothetical protein
MTEATLSSEFYWSNIIFKVWATFWRSLIISSLPFDYVQVEDNLFCVPLCEFVQSSQVFADMFLLPSGPATCSEGQDKEHPIVLEGYKKDEFACLLRVMYPTYVHLLMFMYFDLFLPVVFL